MFSENGVLSSSNVYFYHLESGLEGSAGFFFFFFSFYPLTSITFHSYLAILVLRRVLEWALTWIDWLCFATYYNLFLEWTLEILIIIILANSLKTSYFQVLLHNMLYSFSTNINPALRSPRTLAVNFCMEGCHFLNWGYNFVGYRYEILLC